MHYRFRHDHGSDPTRTGRTIKIPTSAEAADVKLAEKEAIVVPDGQEDISPLFLTSSPAQNFVLPFVCLYDSVAELALAGSWGHVEPVVVWRSSHLQAADYFA